MKMKTKTVAVLWLAGWATAAGAQEERSGLPIAFDVDVVVAGGGCGAVEAAVAAAGKGAKVFLLAPRTYLGEDLAGTMRLWLEPGERAETDLSRAVFADPVARETPSLAYSYKTDRKTSEPHKDTWPYSVLARRAAAVSPQHDSVQYDGDVTITADLGDAKGVGDIVLTSFRRERDFQAGAVTVETSGDGRSWKAAGPVLLRKDKDLDVFTASVNGSFRLARLVVKRAADAKRLLLGRLTFTPSDKPAAPGDATPAAVRPLHAKETLEKALRAAGVEFLYGCYPTELLVDEAGRPAGLVMANRAGRQAVRAKVVIDATGNALLARLAGAEFRAPAAEPRPASFVVIAGAARSGSGVSARKLPFPVEVYDLRGNRPGKQPASWYAYTLPAAAADDSWPARARLEQAVREATYDPSQLYSADEFVVTPAASVRSAAASAPPAWPGADALPLDACRPAAIERLWILGGCVDVPRSQAANLMRPAARMQLGARLGAAAAEQARGVPKSAPVKVVGAAPATGQGYSGEIREPREGLRPIPASPSIRDAEAPLPVLGRYDVVVVGGGTAGAAAGIGAARQGAKTLVVEYLHGLGGVGTLGMIGVYWYGNRVGFAATVPQNPIETRMEFYRSELRKAGGEVWFGAMGIGAAVEGNRVKGVVVATPEGRGVVLADVVVDGTGNSDIAAAAGAETVFVEEFFALQASHVPPREVGASYINGDRRAIDASDPLDVTEAFSVGPRRSFDLGQLLASRERRRMVGDITLDWLDQVNRRTFPDSIALAMSDYDSHGYQIHPYFMLKPSRPPGDHKHQYRSYIPYRCLLPRGLEGLLVVGLGLSAHRDAMPIVRMQPDLQNSGYAAGLAAAMAATSGKTPRGIDVKALQTQLVDDGILAMDVPDHGDSFPPSDTALRDAVRSVVKDYAGLEVLLAHPDGALPLLCRAWDDSSGADKLAYAHVLGVMGSPHGLETLLAEARRRVEKDDLALKKESDGMDRDVQLAWALGRAGDNRAVPVLCELADRAGVSDASRFRAFAVSLGALRNPAAAPVLKRMFDRKAGSGAPEEIIAACALFRCGDVDGAARRALERFAAGFNGPFARLAWQVLKSAK